MNNNPLAFDEMSDSDLSLIDAESMSEDSYDQIPKLEYACGVAMTQYESDPLVITSWVCQDAVCDRFLKLLSEDSAELMSARSLSYEDLPVRERPAFGDYTVEMLKIVFENDKDSMGYEELFMDLYKDHIPKPGPCRKVISGPKGYCYRCLDCQLNPASILCQECFDMSDHTGHRIFKESPDAVCGCGDVKFWKPEGNCSKHTRLDQDDSVLPVDIKSRLITTIQKAFYAILTKMETANEIDFANNLIIILIEDLMLSLKILGKLYPSLISVVGKAVCENFSKPLKMYHRHDDNALPQLFLQDQATCECSVLDLLFRFNMRMTPNAQELASDFLLFATGFEEFEKSLSVAMINYYAFLVRVSKSSSNIVVSKFSSIGEQVLYCNELCAYAFANANVKDMLIGIRNIVNSSLIDNILFYGLFEPFSNSIFYNLKVFLRNPKVAPHFFSNEELVDLWVEIFFEKQHARLGFTQEYKVTQQNINQFQIIAVIADNNAMMDRQCIQFARDVIGSLVFGLGSADSEERELSKKAFRVMVVSLAVKIFGMSFSNHLEYLDYTLERMFVMAYLAYCHFETGSRINRTKTDFSLHIGKFDKDRVFECDEAIMTNFVRDLRILGMTDTEEIYGTAFEMQAQLDMAITTSFVKMNCFIRDIGRGLWVTFM